MCGHRWLYGALGMAAAVGGAWWPARAAERLAPAQALKGLSSAGTTRSRLLPALALLLAAGVLALLPPWRGLPLAAYASVAALLAGGVALVPATVQALLARRVATSQPLLLLAWQRARHQRHTASAAVAGVVASVALSVALLVMVGSFRDAVVVVARWRAAGGPVPANGRRRGRGRRQHVASRLRRPGRVDPRRGARARLARARAVARPASSSGRVDRAAGRPRSERPALDRRRAGGHGDADVFVSEPAAALYGWHVGDTIDLPLPDGAQRLRVAGIWRDYARQFGAVVIEPSLWRRHGGDDARQRGRRVVGSRAPMRPTVIERLRALAGPDVPVDTASAGELRALSLTIFDRSFAVTRYLQAVAIAVGLVGVAASLSAQVLARRKEFGLLVHLGLTRAQVLAIVAGEAAAWLAAGVLLGVAIGIAVSVVLVHVVNPQSFHWTMPLHVPWLRVVTLG